MKYRLISLAAVVLMLAIVAAVQDFQPAENRYHQHLEDEPYTPCTDHGDEVFCTHLPLMNIVTDEAVPEPFLYDEQGQRLENEYGVPISNNEMVAATISYFDGEDSNNHLTDDPVVSERAQLRVRGATSRQYDKKGYLLKIKEENLVDNKDVSFSGMTADSEWVLNGPYWDKSLVRNYLCYNLSGEIMEYAPNVRFIELFLNGEYKGLYLLIEKVKYNDGGRIQLSETDPDSKETSYILQIDRGTTEPLKDIQTFASTTGLTTKYGLSYGQYEIRYPSKTLTEEQRGFIERDISRAEKILSSFDYRDPKVGYPNLIDTQSFIDYFLISEFTLNYDSMGLSTYLYKDVRGKFKLCVWDFNCAFDYFVTTVTDPHIFETQTKMWYGFLFRDDKFVNQVIERYRALRQTVLSDEYLLSYIDETIEYLGPAIDRNFQVWGYTFESSDNELGFTFLKPKERNPKNYEDAVSQLKECVIERGAFMDENIERLYLIGHTSMNKKYNYNKYNYNAGGGFN